jgi:aminopeptidase N
VANVGPWEWGDVLTLVEIPDFGGAMEHTTVMWFDSETIQDAPEGEQIVVHETVHHWWGNSVRFADWPHFWLAEGFDEWHTNFNVMGELLTPEGFDELRSLYREYAAEVSYPFAAGMPLPGPLRFDDDQDVMMQWMTSMNLFYIYGAVFLEMVDQRLRRDFSTDLNTLLSLWYDEKRLDEATTEEFLAFLGEQTSDTSTWEALFDDWVYRTPAPTLELSDYSFTGTEASVTLTRVDGADQDMPGLEVVFASGTDTYPTTVDLTSGTESITATATADAEPDGIIVDPGVFYILRLATAPGWSGPAVGTGTP